MWVLVIRKQLVLIHLVAFHVDVIWDILATEQTAEVR